MLVAKSSTSLITPEELIVLSKKVVERYAHVIPRSEKEDTYLQMVENFLQEEQKITQGFNHKSKASTYCYAVLNRMCCNIIRKEFPTWKKMCSEDSIKTEEGTSPTETANALVIKDELKILEHIFMLLDDRGKTALFLGYFFNNQPKEKYVKEYASTSKRQRLLKFLTPGVRKLKSEKFKNLAAATNFVEDKTIKADAVRMWLNKQQKDIIGRLNGRWSRANYDKETFETLFEIFYRK